MNATLVYVPRLLRDRRPIFHWRGAYRRINPSGTPGDEVRTLCGILVYRFINDPWGVRIDKPQMRRDHAEQVGRGCSTCWRIDARRKGYDA